ncbi:hypothetical protein I309_05255 [Cryptococcus deuterogattii LA55]|nr:hypothetical protein I309_05255 [Cryptococcus deuterogattii LA55]KIR91834.1 hypothetical protein I304_03994 [Cryptococcus deuterogattii CBS 10090]
MPATSQKEEGDQTPNGTQKRPRNANKQWATDIDDNGVSAERHVAIWLASTSQNERLANYHRWTIGHEKKDYLANQCHQYLIEKGCDSRRQVKGVFLKINHIVDTFNRASMLGSGINGNAEEAEGSNLASQRNNICPFYEILAPVLVNRPPTAEHNSSPTLHRSLDPPNPERAASRAGVQRQNENLEDEPFNDDDDADEDDQGAMNVNIRDNGPRRQDGHVSDGADLEMDDVNAVNDRRNELARQKERNDDRRHLEKLVMLRRQHVNLMKYKREKLGFAHRKMDLQERNTKAKERNVELLEYKAKTKEFMVELQERKTKAKERMVELQIYEAKMRRWYNKMDLFIKCGKNWEEASALTGPEPDSIFNI